MSHALDMVGNLSNKAYLIHRKLNPEFPSKSCVSQYRAEFEDYSGFQIDNAIFQSIVYARRKQLPAHKHAGKF